MANGTNSIELRADPERAKGIKLGTFRRSKTGDLTAIQELCAHFVFQDGQYMEFNAAMIALDDLTLEQLMEASKNLNTKVERVFVPLVNEQP